METMRVWVLAVILVVIARNGRRIKIFTKPS